jgi:hypothetical protein
MLGILMRAPLNYRVVRRSGSHRLLASGERPANPRSRFTTRQRCHPEPFARS